MYSRLRFVWCGRENPLVCRGRVDQFWSEISFGPGREGVLGS
nr:MAG TPA: hypothetical protein [Caudoviricetes sp.]DAV65654.1 MAG TPA: hypothetical protein [Caudoviricetes sp.]